MGYSALAASCDPEDTPLLQQTLQAVVSSRASSTMQLYSQPWLAFKSWCDQRPSRGPALPATELTVAMYLQHVVNSASSYAVVKTASAAIYTAHRLAGIPERAIPTKLEKPKAVRAAAKRQLGLKVVNRKDPLDLEDCLAIVAILAPADKEMPVWSLMLATYTMVCFAGFLRYNDAAQLMACDVKIYGDRAELFISKRKNDQFRKGDVVVLARGHTVACPVGLLERYLLSAGLSGAVPLFQSFDGQQARFQPRLAKLSGAALSYEQARYHVLKMVAKVKGITAQEVRALFGLHSLRSGGATFVAKVGVCERDFQAHGGWACRESMLRYLEANLDAKLGVTKVMGY